MGGGYIMVEDVGWNDAGCVGASLVWGEGEGREGAFVFDEGA